jgi:hypothetical protein
VTFRKKEFGLLYGCGLLLLTLSLTATVPAKAQDKNSSTSEDSNLTGTVVSSTRNTVVIRGEDNQYRLFTFDRGATRPRAIPVGSQVRVTSSATDDPGVRTASSVTIVSPPPAGGSTPASQTVVPPEMRNLERDIERQVRRFQGGVRAGVTLDPELVLIGVQGQVGPFFNPNVYLRPNVEFAFGEVTALFALNLEAIYRLPVSSRAGRWSTYVGVGPGFNFLHQNFERNDGEGKRIDFGDFHSAVGLNILGGLRYRSGVFVELKTSVYASPAPTLRMIVGYNF